MLRPGDFVYRDGPMWAVLRITGEGAPIWSGVGATPDQAAKNLCRTPVMAEGLEPEDAAVDWAVSAGLLTAPDYEGSPRDLGVAL